MFIKTFPDLLPEQVQILEKHSREVYASLCDSEFVVCPSVLSFSAQSIEYESVNCSDELLSRLECGLTTERDMLLAGRILRLIHDAGVLHSDYVPHNLFHDGSKIVVIDFHPPEGVSFEQSMLYGERSTEVIGFCLVILADVGLKKSLMNFRYYVKLIKQFLLGYDDREYLKVRYVRSLFALYQKTYQYKISNGFSIARAFGHSVAASLMTYISVRAAL